MDIIYKFGSVFEELQKRTRYITVLAHCCNAQGVMGSGIALSIKQQFPDAFAAYKASGHELGTISYTNEIANLVGQFNYGYDGQRYMNYGALSNCFILLNEHLLERQEKLDTDEKPTIILPYLMACDRAGGDWATVIELFEWHCKDCKGVVCRL